MASREKLVERVRSLTRKFATGSRGVVKRKVAEKRAARSCEL